MNSNAERNAIAELDLEPVKVKLMHKESGEGWSRAQVDAVAVEYRRFLHLLKLFPDEQVAPRADVDIFWHYHILDTMKYAVDCEQFFGYFLHHYPYLGLEGNDEDNEAVHRRTGDRMQELYEATFNEAYIRQDQDHSTTASAHALVDSTAWCGPMTLNQTAWCGPMTVKQTAWCGPMAVKQTAWCGPMAMKQTAWCGPMSVKQTAWCGPMTVNTASTQGAVAITARTRTVAQNDSVYSHQALAMAA